MTLLNHIPVLQVLIPFFAALFSVLTFNKLFAWLVAVCAISINLALSIYTQSNFPNSLIYLFGNWQAPIGIEYRLDNLNQPIIVYINAVLLFFLVFGKQLINQTITKYIDQEKQHIFYSLLLFAHSGYLGVLSTNDLFNIYVFLELSSLATYVLISSGNNPKALIGSFDYLIMGSIGVTMILISIGFFFAMTGSLNISDISEILKNNDSLISVKLLTVAIVFFLSGAILKMAFFPLHFWMIKAYSATSPFVLTYIAAISSIIGIYLIMRFMHFTIEAELVKIPLGFLLRIMSWFTIIICTFLALKSNDIKLIIIYSSASQIGYIFLILSIWSSNSLLFQFLIFDSINKVALFTLIAHIQNKTSNLKIISLKKIKKSGLFKILAGFVILFSAGLPLTGMFFIKIKLFELLLQKNLLIDFIVVLIGSICALLYHIKLATAIFFSKEENGIIKIKTNILGLIAIIIIQVTSIHYIGNSFHSIEMISTSSFKNYFTAASITKAYT